MLAAVGCGQKTLTEGIVYDDFGHPLPGATVSFGSSHSAITGGDGKFSLDPENETGDVSISAPGYVGRTISGYTSEYWKEEYGNFQLNAQSGTGVTGTIRLAQPLARDITFEVHHTADNGLNPLFVSLPAGETSVAYTLYSPPAGEYQVYATATYGGQLYLGLTGRVTSTHGSGDLDLRPVPVATGDISGTVTSPPSGVDSFRVRAWGQLTAARNGVPGEGKVYCSLPAAWTGSRYEVPAWFDADYVRSYTVVLEAFHGGEVSRSWSDPVQLNSISVNLAAPLAVAEGVTGSRAAGFHWTAVPGADYYLVKFYGTWVVLPSGPSWQVLVWTLETEGTSIDMPQLPSGVGGDLAGEPRWTLEARRVPGFDLMTNPSWESYRSWSRTEPQYLYP